MSDRVLFRISYVAQVTCKGGLRPRPHVAGYFRKRRSFPPYFKNNLRPHVAFLIRIWPSTRNRVFSKTEGFFSPYLKKSASTCSRFRIVCAEERALNLGMTSSYLKTSVFAGPHEYDEYSPPWRTYLKTSVFGAPKRWIRVDGSRIRRKKSPFSKVPGYAWAGSK